MDAYTEPLSEPKGAELEAAIDYCDDLVRRYEILQALPADQRSLQHWRREAAFIAQNRADIFSFLPASLHPRYREALGIEDLRDTDPFYPRFIYKDPAPK